jgi:hypothetical protein
MVEPSAKVPLKSGRELSLGEVFGPAVIRFNGFTVSTDGYGNVKLETDRVTAHIADGDTVIYGGNVTTHTDGIVIQLKAPAEEQTNTPDNSIDVISSSVDVKSFSPDNSIIRAGTVQLNKISQYLDDLPDTATATLLVSPQDLANIDGGGLGTWVESVQRIRDIKNYHGLDGMEIYDHPGTARGTTYEKALADQIKAAFAQAQSSGQEVTTGLFMPTKQLVDGREIGSDDVSVDTNLYSKRKEIGKQGDEFITKRGSDDARWQWSATEYPDYSSNVCNVDFTDGVGVWVRKYPSRLSSRPVALQISPSL